MRSISAALLGLFAAALMTTAGPAAAREPADEAAGTNAAPGAKFELRDVFELEWASDPQVMPDGRSVVYVRNSFDIMTDKPRANIWRIDIDGDNHRPILSGKQSYSSPRLSPDGGRLAYIASHEGSPQVYVRYLDTGQTARLTDLTEAPSDLSWAPDGERLAFTMRVPADPRPLGVMPPAPEGADWAKPVKVINRLTWRVDGRGLVDPGYTHIFVVPAEGGTPRRLTFGEFNHSGSLSWAPDGDTLYFSSNREKDWEYAGRDSEIYALDLANGNVTPLTEREGPDDAPVVSPDGRRIAYTGFDDEKLGYQVARLSVMNADGTDSRVLTGDLDRTVYAPRWAPDGRAVYFLYDDRGVTKLAAATLDGKVRTLAEDIGGASLGRPYPSGVFDIGAKGPAATIVTAPERPADLAVIGRDGKLKRITDLNEDLLGRKNMATIAGFEAESRHDGRMIQAWALLPPDFDPDAGHPMVLEIHGGPFANYGPRFSAEMQLFAAAGYVVVYANPRDSTSYGQAFGNLIHHNYPGEDFDDLMSVVDTAIAKGYGSEDRLYVTGGSGGGVLTSWIVGSTDRFEAAVVAKPVINWQSFVLTADFANFFAEYWFPAMPWEAPEHYWQRSPLSLVGNVTTPTMLLTGEADYRTPMSETEQFYTALKLRKVDTALVRVPGAGHAIAARPSQLIAKVVNILGWFERYGGGPAGPAEE